MPRILGVKRALTPRAHADRAAGRAVNLFLRNAAQFLRPREERIQIVDGELLSWHGSRTPAGIDYAERVIAAAGNFMPAAG